MFRSLSLIAAGVVLCLVVIGLSNNAQASGDPPFPAPHVTASFTKITLTVDPYTKVQRVTIGDKTYAIVNDYVDGKVVDALPLPDGYDNKTVWVVPETGLRDGHPHIRIFWNCFPTSRKTTRGMLLVK